ncbi:MAG TPA: sigma-70 family RNA polymerase sigma factor [Solirubrobacteraceae bacterium]|nr:sigma-70 family RNA polymerase sigma factor [Solirubrobacteraceae bacterium]
MSALRPPTSAAPDLDGLYRTSAVRLAGIVRRQLGAPEVVVEDACQSAWSKLLRHRQTVARETAFSWLATTAVREALRIVARTERELSLEANLEGGVRAEALTLPVEEGPEQLVGERLRIEDLRNLPRRQQRLLWLQALGSSHAEIAALSGCTTRTVHRQLHRARRRLRELAAEPE